METVNIEKSYGADKITRYYLTHSSADESIILTQEELEGLYLQLFNIVLPPKEKNSNPKLIIHETDCHGCGVIKYGVNVVRYTYDDGCFGGVRNTVENLIDIGFIDADRVVIFEEDEIYEHLDIE